MAPIIPIIGIIGSGLSAVTAVGGAIIQSRQMRERAELAEQAGQIEGDRTRREGRRSIAARAARFAGSGVVVGTGSTLDVLADEAAEVEEKALLRAFAGDIRASDLRAQAGQTLASGIISGIGSIGTAVGFGGQLADIGRAPLGTSPITIPRSRLIGPPA